MGLSMEICQAVFSMDLHRKCKLKKYVGNFFVNYFMKQEEMVGFRKQLNKTENYDQIEGVELQSHPLVWKQN